MPESEDEQMEAQPPTENAADEDDGVVVIADDEDAQIGMDAVGAEVILNGNGDAEGDADTDADPFYGFEDVEEADEAAAVEEDEENPSYENKDMPKVLQIWEKEHTKPGFSPEPVLKRFWLCICLIEEKKFLFYF